MAVFPTLHEDEGKMGRDRERIGGSEDTHQLWGKEVRIKGCERERRRGDTHSLPVSHHHTLGMLTARGPPIWAPLS